MKRFFCIFCVLILLTVSCCSLAENETLQITGAAYFEGTPDQWFGDEAHRTVSLIMGLLYTAGSANAEGPAAEFGEAVLAQFADPASIRSVRTGLDGDSVLLLYEDAAGSFLQLTVRDGVIEAVRTDKAPNVTLTEGDLDGFRTYLEQYAGDASMLTYIGTAEYAVVSSTPAASNGDALAALNALLGFAQTAPEAPEVPAAPEAPAAPEVSVSSLAAALSAAQSNAQPAPTADTVSSLAAALSAVQSNAQPAPTAAPSNSAATLTNIRFRTNLNLDVTVTWDDSGNNGPYTVRNRIEGGTVDWNNPQVSTTSCTITDMVPGETYTILIEDSRGNTAAAEYTVPEGAPFTQFRNPIALTFHTRVSIDDQVGSRALSALEITSVIESEDDSVEFGGRLTLEYPQLANPRMYSRKIFLRCPEGYAAYATHADEWEMPAGNYYNYYDFFDITHSLRAIYRDYGYIPQGTYTLELYLNGEAAGQVDFKVGK